LKALLENYFKPSIIFLKISLQACLQKKSLTKCFIKLSLPKDCLKDIFQKLSYESFSLILKRDYLKPKFYLLYANKNLWPFHMDFMESCSNYENLFITVLYGCFELLKLCKVGLDRFDSNLKRV
jgi:hypothetical protein